MDGSRARPRVWRTVREFRAGPGLAFAIAPAWIVLIIVLWQAVSSGVDLEPLIIGAPAIACAASGRKLCVVMSGLCAAAVVAVRTPDAPRLSVRLGMGLAVLVVAASAYAIARVRLRLDGELADIRRIADVAQQVLLPPLPARIGPVRMAVRSIGTDRHARIGGDFYEALLTDHGVRVVVGDVRGSGLGAVRLAAAVLGAFREAAYDEAELSGIVRRMEASLLRALANPRDRPYGEQPTAGTDYGLEDFVTIVVVGLTWAETPVLEVLSRGHPAPVLLAAHGPVVLDGVVAGPPLGLGDLLPFGSTDDPLPLTHRLPLIPGDAVFLYTDGVTEARDAQGSFFPLEASLRGLDHCDPDKALRKMHETLLRHLDAAAGDEATMLLVGLGECGPAGGAASDSLSASGR